MYADCAERRERHDGHRPSVPASLLIPDLLERLPDHQGSPADVLVAVVSEVALSVGVEHPAVFGRRLRASGRRGNCLLVWSDLQHGAVGAQRHRDALSDRCGLHARTVDEQPVAALQVADDPLPAEPRHLRVPAADACIVDVNLAALLASDEERAGEAEGASIRQLDDDRPRTGCGRRFSSSHRTLSWSHVGAA